MVARPIGARLVLFDGQVWSCRRVRVGDDGVIRTADKPVIEFSGGAAVLVEPGLYVLCAQPVALRAETDFHQLRRQVVLRALFENTGDVMDMLRNGAALACLVVALVLLMALHNLGGSVGVLSGAVQDVVSTQHRLSAPVVPAGYELVPVPVPTVAGGSGR